MARQYPQADIKILYGRAAGRCSFAVCRKEIVLEKTAKDKTKQIGKIAHIIAHGENGPRASNSYPKDKLDKYENWLLLCSNCHDTIDAQSNTYSVDYLRKIKYDHEKWVREKLSSSMPSIGFAELEIVAKGILSSNGEKTDGFIISPPLAKMHKNGLTATAGQLITIGLSRGKEVEKFIIHISQIDNTFPDRLTAGFRKKYNELLSNGLLGDALFEGMFEFASGGYTDFKEKAAGLAVLCHLFVACEVFEK